MPRRRTASASLTSPRSSRSCLRRTRTGSWASRSSSGCAGRNLISIMDDPFGYDVERGGPMKVDGSCHCGTIRFEAEIDPNKVVLCHCTDCQTLSGTAFRTVVPAIAGTFRLLSGAPTVYVKTGESGNKREQTFCPDCGTPIYSATVGADP